MKIVIVGNGPAAVRALEAIAAHKDVSNAGEEEITVISGELTAPYSPMFLGGYLTGELGEKEILIGEKHSLSPGKILGDKVVEVVDSENRVILESGREVGYDKLLIASGASATKPPLKGIDKEGVFFFNRLADVKRLSEKLPEAKDIIIIGAGAIGIEAAITFNKMGKSVLIVEMLYQCLPQMLDDDLARHVERRLSSLGIRFWLDCCVSEITGDNRATGIVAGDKEIIGDVVLLACGLSPNVDFLKSSNVKVNSGILVNEKMQTNIPNIYAAGDVAESIDPYGGYELVFNWYNAVDQGWTAGCNLIGIEDTYKASPGLAILKGAEPPVISIGRKYGENGYETLSVANEGEGAYEKFFIKNDRIECYQAIGISDKVGLMYGYIKERKDVRGIKNILHDNYNPAKLIA